MTTQERLVEGMAKAFPGDSQAELARRAGLSPQRYNNYAQGLRTMDVDAVIGCAQALGWDVRETVGTHLAEKAESKRENKFWKEVIAALSILGAVALGAFAFGQPEAWLAGSSLIALGFPVTHDVHYAKYSPKLNPPGLQPPPQGFAVQSPMAPPPCCAVNLSPPWERGRGQVGGGDILPGL